MSTLGGVLFMTVFMALGLLFFTVTLVIVLALLLPTWAITIPPTAIIYVLKGLNILW